MKKMKIAVTSEKDGTIFQHFGHSEFFAIFETEDGNITSSSIVNTEGSGHSDLVSFLKGRKIDILICGGIGGKAKVLLADCGIEVVSGVEGLAKEAVKMYLAGNLQDNPDALCTHHSHECDHDDKGHQCGQNCHDSK